MSAFSPAARALVQQLRAAPRGPRRDGCFALWLVLRVAEDLQLDPPVAERAARRRVDLLSRRITSLTLSPPLRRAVAAAIRSLEDGRGADPSRVLTQLAQAAREVLGPDAGEALSRAARASRPRPSP